MPLPLQHRLPQTPPILPCSSCRHVITKPRLLASITIFLSAQPTGNALTSLVVLDTRLIKGEDLNQNKPTAPMLVMSSRGTGCGDGIPPAPYRVTRFAERDDFIKHLQSANHWQPSRQDPKTDHQAALSRPAPETPGCPSLQRYCCVTELIEISL